MMNVEQGVSVRVGEQEDSIEGVMMRGKLPAMVKRYRLFSDPDQRRSVRTLRSTVYWGKAPARLIFPLCAPKKSENKIKVSCHCRVVYTEISVPLHSPEMLSGAIAVLDDVTFGKSC